jgi:hypothetical protein
VTQLARVEHGEGARGFELFDQRQHAALGIGLHKSW